MIWKSLIQVESKDPASQVVNIEGQSAKQPPYRTNEPLAREDEIENAGLEPGMFRKDEYDLL